MLKPGPVRILVSPRPAPPSCDQDNGEVDGRDNRVTYLTDRANSLGVLPKPTPGILFSAPAERPSWEPDARAFALDNITRLLAQFEADEGREATILDWRSGLDLANSIKQGVVVVPPTFEPKLAYLDATFDFVAVPARDEGAVREARRVAAEGLLLIDCCSDPNLVVLRANGPKRLEGEAGPQIAPFLARTPGLPKRRALVCAFQLPEFDRKSGSRRTWDVVAGLLAAGWEVVFLAVDRLGLERYARLLQKNGVEVVAEEDCCIDRLLSKGSFDLLYIGFWYVAERYLPLARTLSPATRIIIDSIDLHFVREARRGPVGPEYVDETRRELAVYAQADKVLTVSQNEAEILKGMLGDAQLVAVVPDGENLALSSVPFDERRGILFVGNFLHPPNGDAIRYLCNEIIPQLDPAILAEHPVRIVGNQPDDDLLDLVGGRSDFRMVGWVPSVVPELHQARISVIPLRYGAGTKRKLIQALMAGTPTVATSIGVEGLELIDGEHVLIADDAESFAIAIARLVANQSLWEKLAKQGRAHILARHQGVACRERLLNVIANLLVSQPAYKLPRPMNKSLKDDLPCSIEIPPRAKVIVAGLGEPQPRIWHGSENLSQWRQESPVQFPASSREAIAHIDGLRVSDADYLFIPSHSRWWLSNYPKLISYLDSCAGCVLQDERGSIYEFNRDLPACPDRAGRLTPIRSRPRVLVAGICLVDVPNHVESLVASFAESSTYDVEQRWVSMGLKPPSPRLSTVTVWTQRALEPKFAVMNRLLADIDWESYEYLIISDDDILLPAGFVDGYLSLQTESSYLLAQPARTENSYIDHPIVGRQRGLRARQTLFVEIGPLFSVHRSIVPLLLPFDLTSPMGWGYEYIWSRELSERGLKMGILDAFPVDHSLRPPHAHYAWSVADANRKQLLESRPHFSLEECHRVLDIIPEKARL